MVFSLFLSIFTVAYPNKKTCFSGNKFEIQNFSANWIIANAESVYNTIISIFNKWSTR